MVTYPLASPVQFGVARLEWAALGNTARGRSPWTLQDVVQVYDGETWRGRLTIMPQEEADGRRLAAWITALRGTRGTFLLGHPTASAPLGSASGSPGAPVVDGAGQTGSTLNLRGLPASATGYLLAGDYVQLGTGVGARLHMALADVDSDASGEAAIDVFPAIRTAPADGAAVVVSGAEGLFALTRPSTPHQVRGGLVYDGVTLDVAEVVK